MTDTLFLKQLEIKCRIGIFDWERRILQKVHVDLEFPTNTRRAARRDRIQDTVDYKKIAKHTIRYVSESQFFLLETLAEKLAQSILKKFKLAWVKLRLSKPGAIRGAKSVGIEIVRRKK